MELEAFYFYNMLDEKSKAYLKEVIKPITAPKGSILFFQGDTCNDILPLAETIEEIKFIRLEDRLIRWLKKQGKSLLQITHEELALELESSRVVISRALKALEQQNKVTLHRGAIKLHLM